MTLLGGFRELDAGPVMDLSINFRRSPIDGDKDEDVGGGDDKHREEIETDVHQGYQSNL